MVIAFEHKVTCRRCGTRFFLREYVGLPGGLYGSPAPCPKAKHNYTFCRSWHVPKLKHKQ